jgi:hypothetical protein
MTNAVLSNITNKIIDVIANEMTKDDMKIKIQHQVINPLMVVLYKQLYPYIYCFVIIFCLMFFMMILLLVCFFVYLRK